MSKISEGTIEVCSECDGRVRSACHKQREELEAELAGSHSWQRRLRILALEAEVRQLREALKAYVEPLPMHKGPCRMENGRCLLEAAQKVERMNRAVATLAAPAPSSTEAGDDS